MKHIYLLLLLFFCSTVFGQRGKNGVLTVSSTITVNEYTALTADAAVGNTSITVAASSLNSHNRFSKNLAPGDLIMIIQMQGTTINGAPDSANNQISMPNDSSWGAILNYNNCGNNEIREVLSVPNGTTINLTCPLINNYTSAGKVQVVRIPRYSRLTINNSGEIICDAWNGVSGGVIAIENLGNTIINAGGQINAYASGFRGGILQNSSAIETNISYFASNQPTEYGAFKGEGIAGNGNDYNQFGGRVCMGAPANGGGGGDSWNAGGGGGANGGNISGWINGYGIPDISQPGYITAWNEEYTWMSSFVGAGGGRGGYTWSGSVLDPLTVPPGDAGWGGDSRRSVGGRGGRPLDYSTGRLFLGGGGGAGSEDNNDAGNGGSGGGMVYLVSYGTVSGSGMVLANGHNGVSDTLVPGDGPGGAGAGGTIVINSTGNIAGITIEANGGKGGNQANTSPEGEGPGGGGGGGYIATSNSVTEIVNGGTNGATTTFPTFPANGSTQGGPGDTATVTNFIILAKNDTICPDTSAVLKAILSGTIPGGTTIGWYDSITRGSLLGSGATYTTPILTKTTVFYVSTCPGSYRQPDTVFVTGVGAIITSPNDSICKGDSTWLVAGGGSAYLWSTNQTADSIEVGPLLVTTTYTLTAYARGCSGNKTITVFVRPPVTATIHAIPDTVCHLGLSTIVAVAAGEPARYHWNTGGTHDTIDVNPAVTTTYTVDVYGVCDTTHQIIKVYVVPLAKPVIIGTTFKCKGVIDTLYASGGTSYVWSNGNTTSTYKTGPIEADSTVTLTTYNSLGCPSDTTFYISIRTLTVVTVPPTMACTGSSVMLYPMPPVPGAGTWNYLWAPGGLTTDSITVVDSVATTYTLTISNSSGCQEKVTASVTPYNPALTACCSKTILRGDDTIMVAYGSSIQTYSWTPEVDCLNPSCDSARVTPSVTTTYTVIGTDSSGCATERVITIVVEAPCFNFIVPNVFTPTNSGLYGLDNIFYIKTENLSAWAIDIYNRWGAEVFKSTNPTQYWDGNVEGGGEAPAGVYYYIINSICQGTTYKKDGFVQLIR